MQGKSGVSLRGSEKYFYESETYFYGSEKIFLKK